MIGDVFVCLFRALGNIVKLPPLKLTLSEGLTFFIIPSSISGECCEINAPF